MSRRHVAGGRWAAAAFSLALATTFLSHAPTAEAAGGGDKKVLAEKNKKLGAAEKAKAAAVDKAKVKIATKLAKAKQLKKEKAKQAGFGKHHEKVKIKKIPPAPGGPGTGPGPAEVPELSAGGLLSGLVLIAGAFLLLRGRRRNAATLAKL